MKQASRCAFLHYWLIGLLSIYGCSSKIDQNTTGYSDSQEIDSSEAPKYSYPDSTKAYNAALSKYIQAMLQTHAPKFDTVYIANPELHQGVLFSHSLEGKRIIPMTEIAAAAHPGESKSFIVVNIAWADFELSPIEFMFYTFYHNGIDRLPNGVIPQHKSFVYLDFDSTNNDYLPAGDVRFEMHDTSTQTK